MKLRFRPLSLNSLGLLFYTSNSQGAGCKVLIGLEDKRSKKSVDEVVLLGVLVYSRRVVMMLYGRSFDGDQLEVVESGEEISIVGVKQCREDECEVNKLVIWKVKLCNVDVYSWRAG